MHLMVLRAFWRTCTQRDPLPTASCLNAPYGAPRFLTCTLVAVQEGADPVLMHLMALRAC